MGFRSSPQVYTVRLSDDLVCAGTWKFDGDYVTTTWDLDGHAMTFLSEYSSNEHRGRTNVVVNGTMAFTNAAGAVQRVNFSNARAGAALFLRENASFIGNVSFTDDSAKTLEVTDGAQMTGTIGISGTGSRGLVSGAGTAVNLGGYQKACDVGDEGTGARLVMSDALIAKASAAAAAARPGSSVALSDDGKTLTLRAGSTLGSMLIVR